MTDEEKAEEYVENKYHCNRSECIQGNSCDYCYREGSKRDYLAGLAEGKPKWHDLRKDPSDLPTRGNVTIRCVLNNRNEVICETDWYSPTEDEIGYGKVIIQFYSNDDWIDTNDVIAWCELPKFEGYTE